MNVHAVSSMKSAEKHLIYCFVALSLVERVWKIPQQPLNLEWVGVDWLGTCNLLSQSRAVQLQ